MLRRLLQRRAKTTPRVCKCGNPLNLRVVGVGQRWGGEPISAVSCLHCERCGDVTGSWARSRPALGKRFTCLTQAAFRARLACGHVAAIDRTLSIWLASPPLGRPGGAG